MFPGFFSPIDPAPWKKIIREKRPDVQILLMGPTPGKHNFQELDNDWLRKQNLTMRDEAIRRIKAGDANISYFDALNNSLGDDFWECAVDGVHLTDMGFYRLSQALCKFLNGN